MTEAAAEISSATLAFVQATRGDQTEYFISREVSPEWDRVCRAIECHVPAARRPDLYAATGLSSSTLLQASGLLSAAAAEVPAPTLAADFAAFCLRPAPEVSEDWILLDTNAPGGLSLHLGDYMLETHTRAELARLQPLPCVVAEDLEAGELPPGPLEQSAFLRIERPDRPIQPGLHWLFPFDSLIEIEHWRPLLVLALWSTGITRAEALYEVERGRRIERVAGEPALMPEVAVQGDGSPVEHTAHAKQGITLDESELAALTAFADAVLQLVERVMARLDGKDKPPKQLARRLQAASTHLLRASHRTRGPHGFHSVSAYEFHEVLLHYVIAMEALLADVSDQLDLSRKVEYRAAMLFDTDEERVRVGKLVKTAYAQRSKYVHGDEVRSSVDLEDLRETACAVLLRWLVLTAGTEAAGPVKDAQTIPSLLDRAALSEATRREQVSRPLQSFFEATPPHQLATFAP